MRPYIYDTRQLIKCLRDKILTKRELNDHDKRILEQVDVVRRHHLSLGGVDKFKDEMK